MERLLEWRKSDQRQILAPKSPRGKSVAEALRAQESMSMTKFLDSAIGKASDQGASINTKCKRQEEHEQDPVGRAVAMVC